ncbi:MAG TPA: D-glucuronyl C5-epimerase family protein [Ferruginibacter sp.]|nr:D-glucuronyl C5-epimerase family protein [Ferruginibacter sp.]
MILLNDLCLNIIMSLQRNKKRWRYFLLVTVSIITASILCNYNGVRWEGNVRKAINNISRDSIPLSDQVLVDSTGVPYSYYAEQNGIKPGFQYNPTIVSNYAIEYYKIILLNNDSSTIVKFLNCINSLAENISYKINYALYEFNWQQPWYPLVRTPYTSGMTSGRAIEAFTYAYRLTQDEKYLLLAGSLLRGFYQPIEDGGFTYKSDSGWWYEEIADTLMHTPHILDGHIFAITGLHQYWLSTKSDSAAFIFEKGIEALRFKLPSYDDGNGWSFYDGYKNPTSQKYHSIITAQMKQLWEISGDSIFLQYHQKWKATANKNYLYSVVEDKNRSGILLLILITFIVAAIIYPLLKWFLYK